jgi:hypothetical protein
MIKIQVQTYSKDEVSKYTSYLSNAIPTVGHTLKVGEHYYTVTSVTWFVPSADEVVDQVHVSAEKQQ